MSLPYPLDYQNLLQVGPSSYSDGTRVAMRGGNFGETVVQELFGKYFELTRRQMVFSAVTTSAVQLTNVSTFSNGPCLWNRLSSNKLVIPLILNLFPATNATVGSWAIGPLAVGAIVGTGDSAGTNLPFATFTNQTPVPMALGKGACYSYFAAATVTLTAAASMTRVMDLGMGQFAAATNAVTGMPVQFSYDFHGALVLGPGTAISVGYGATYSATNTYNVTIVFAEVPLPVGY